MSAAIKSIYATITDHVQMVGYREIVEAHGKARGLAGLVFNDVDGSVKVVASGPESAITDFIHDLKLTRPDTKIETKEIIEYIPLPAPFGRVVVDEMREISERLDKGNMILGEMNLKLDKLNVIGDKLDTLGDKLDKLDVIGDKLDSLPERIAAALK